MASISKTSASNHVGWTSGDGRVYNNNVCRELDSAQDNEYYVYGFGFGSLPVDATVTGVIIQHHISILPIAPVYNIGLCVSVIKRGTQKTGLPGGDASWSCPTAPLRTIGSSGDLWGLTASVLKGYIENANFGFWRCSK